MSKSVLYSLLIVMVALNLFLLLKATLISPALEHTTSDTSHYTNLLRNKILLQTTFSPVSVNFQSLATDTAGKELVLDELFKNNETLVFFFTSKHCYSCIDAAIPRLDALANDIGLEKIVLLAELEEKRDIVSFKAKYHSRLQIYEIDSSAVTGEAKNVSHPFLFLITKGRKTHNPFFVESDLPEVSEDYLSLIRTYFMNRKAAVMNDRLQDLDLYKRL